MLSTYLSFPGMCREAFDFYAEALNGEIVECHTFAGSPMADQVPPEWGDKIMHCTLKLPDGSLLMGCDNAEAKDGFKGFNVMIAPVNVAEGQKCFDMLASGGSVIMPFEKTFWAERFGMLVDRFGLTWAVNCDLPQAA